MTHFNIPVLLGFAIVIAVGALPATADDPGDATLSIMPLGDSLTIGLTLGPLSTDYYTPGGYRYPLYQDLTGEGVNFNYVGINISNPGGLPVGQQGFNGFGGYTIQDIDNNLTGNVTPSDNPYYAGDPNAGGHWLDGNSQHPAETANLILLEVGTNDLYINGPRNGDTQVATQAAQAATLALTNLINDLRADEPGVTILVASVPPLLDPSLNLAVADYAADVQNLVATTFQGDDVDYVDMYDAFMDNGGTSLINADPDPSGNPQDGIHPTAKGYGIMATTWNTAIENDVINPPAAAAPEPSTWALIASGLLGLWGLHRRSRASAQRR